MINSVELLRIMLALATDPVSPHTYSIAKASVCNQFFFFIPSTSTVYVANSHQLQIRTINTLMREF